MSQLVESKNKALVLEAFDTLFNKRDYAAAERFWSSNYIQHSAHIEPGREGLFQPDQGSPFVLKSEPGLIAADGDFVIVHGRFSGTGRPGADRADVVRVADGVLVEHWDVLQDEASARSQRAVCQCSALSSVSERIGSEQTICISASPLYQRL